MTDAEQNLQRLEVTRPQMWQGIEAGRIISLIRSILISPLCVSDVSRVSWMLLAVPYISHDIAPHSAREQE